MKIVRIIILILLVSVIVLAVYWYLSQRTSSPAASVLTGSGTVEANQVTISPEMAGRVIEVSVGEGDQVKAGDTLFKLDDTLIIAQRDQAQTNLQAAQAGLEAANTAVDAAQVGVTTAQAQYDLALAIARMQAQPARSLAWGQSQPAQFDQPVWYFTHTEEITAALKEVNAANEALLAASASLDSMNSSGISPDLAASESRLAQAQAAFLNASDVLDRAQMQDYASLQDAAQQAYDDARAELDSAQQAYAELLTSQEAQDILDARAKLVAAQERYETAVDRYNALRTGEQALSVRVAASTLAQAQANVTAAKSRVSQAQAAVDQAQAALNLIDVQMGKLVITAPVDGVVMARNIEPGETVISGATALSLGELDHLTITVYIPENRYGEIMLGDQAIVGVDSFPTQIFTALVSRIADQAEFTPRNVQTVEGRSTTVYAVELSVPNTTGLLKPGMPADVTFLKPVP